MEKGEKTVKPWLQCEIPVLQLTIMTEPGQKLSEINRQDNSKDFAH